jgi:phosphoserine phosphatase
MTVAYAKMLIRLLLGKYLKMLRGHEEDYLKSVLEQDSLTSGQMRVIEDIWNRVVYKL